MDRERKRRRRRSQLAQEISQAALVRTCHLTVVVRLTLSIRVRFVKFHSLTKTVQPPLFVLCMRPGSWSKDAGRRL